MADLPVPIPKRFRDQFSAHSIRMRIADRSFISLQSHKKTNEDCSLTREIHGGAIILLLCLLLIPTVFAHAPLGIGDNESIDRATVIPDPTKSWALYAHLNSDGDAQYYTFNTTTGQKIHVMMYKSTRPEDATFTPRVVIIGPSVIAQGNIPSKITIPSGLDAQLVNQTEPQPTYEPFSPSTFIGLADATIENPIAGQYYVVVYEQSDTPRGGNYGLAIGDRESYTVDEWILIPFNLMNIYQWEGQSLTMVLAPMIATLLLGVVLVVWRLRKQGSLSNPMALLGAVAGLTFIGTGVTVICQMLLAAMRVAIGTEAVITLIFAIVPLIIGLVTFRLSIKDSFKASIKKRIYYIILGIAALFIWSGLIIGPVLTIVASIMPTPIRKDNA